MSHGGAGHVSGHHAGHHGGPQGGHHHGGDGLQVPLVDTPGGRAARRDPWVTVYLLGIAVVVGLVIVFLR